MKSFPVTFVATGIPHGAYREISLIYREKINTVYVTEIVVGLELSGSEMDLHVSVSVKWH